jgi:5-methylcytosine-specific restriction endonuclease McrA
MPAGRPTKKMTTDGNLVCTCCNKELPLNEFSISTRSAIGYQSTCKKCQKDYRDTHKDQMASYLAKTKEQRSRQMRDYFESHRDSINGWRRNYYANEGHLKVLSEHAERRAKKISTSDGSVTPEFLEELYIVQDGMCNICGLPFGKGKNSFHVDHIVPLAKGGEHKDSNIQLLCPSCNTRKRDDIVQEIAVGRPTKYDPAIDLPLIIKGMSEGCSIAEVCTIIGISRDTLYKWKDKYPLFSDTIKRGEELSEAWWLANGRTNLENRDFNATLYYMNMKNRHGWSDKQETKETGNLTVKIVTYSEADGD